MKADVKQGQLGSHFRWEEFRRDPKWHLKGGEWGSLRAVYPSLLSANLAVHLVRVPGGQRSPWHAAAAGKITTNRLILHLVGEIEFSIASKVFPLAPLDILTLNDSPYSYQNPGFSDALFWTISRRDRERLYSREQRATGAGATYWESEPPQDPNAAERIQHMRWEEYRRNIDWRQPNSENWGSHLGAYPGIEIERLRGMMFRLPAGQAIQPEELPHDALFFGVQGEIEFQVGPDIYPLGRLDLIAVAPQRSFRYINAGFTDALFFEVAPRD